MACYFFEAGKQSRFGEDIGSGSPCIPSNDLIEKAESSGGAQVSSMRQIIQYWYLLRFLEPSDNENALNGSSHEENYYKVPRNNGNY